MEILKTARRIWESFGQLKFRLRVKCPGGSRQNISTPVPGITSVTDLIRISLSFHFMFTNVVNFSSFEAGDALSVTVLAPAPSKMPYWLRFHNLLKKSRVESKEVNGS